MKRIRLSDHFTCRKLLLFSLPSIGMQLIDNTYQIADGYFISNCIGEKAFEAENLIFPPLTILICVGLMFGTGSSALIAKELGEGAQGTVLHVDIRVVTVHREPSPVLFSGCNSAQRTVPCAFQGTVRDH